MPKNFRNSSFGLITRCQNCGKRYFLPGRRGGSGLATCVGGVVVLGVAVFCCGGLALIGSRSHRDPAPDAHKEPRTVARVQDRNANAELQPAVAGGEPAPEVGPAQPMSERLTILPRQLPTPEEEADAADRFRLAKAFYNGKNYQTAKEVLTFLVGEYTDTKAALEARQFLDRKELAVIDVAPYVRKPRPEVAQGPPRKSDSKPEPVYDQPPPSEANGVVFLPTRHDKGGTVNVRGYTRKDGTYVAPYTRHAPRR
jgi:hypothetical protein